MRQTPFSLTPWVRGLLIANAVVYLLTITVFTGPWFFDLFAFQPRQLLFRWWTPFTYLFLHAGFLHLAMNCLLLFVFGPAVEEKWGSRTFGMYYFICGFGGAALSFAMLIFGYAPPVIGASGAILGIGLAFVLNWPDAPMMIFPLPFPIKVKWFFTFIVLTDLFAALAGRDTGIAHFAHLGGVLFGFLYIKGEQAISGKTKTVVASARRPASVVPQTVRRPRARRAAEPVQKLKRSTRSIHDEVDRVLEKISELGLDSLTPKERQLLDEMSQHYRDS